MNRDEHGSHSDVVARVAVAFGMSRSTLTCANLGRLYARPDAVMSALPTGLPICNDFGKVRAICDITSTQDVKAQQAAQIPAVLFLLTATVQNQLRITITSGQSDV